VYRSLLRHVKALPNKRERERYWNETVSTFRENRNLQPPPDQIVGDVCEPPPWAEWNTAMATAKSKLAFLRMTIPQSKRPQLPPELQASNMVGYDRYGEKVYERGADRTKLNFRVWNGPTNEEMERHREIEKRMNFSGKYWNNGVYVGPRQRKS